MIIIRLVAIVLPLSSLESDYRVRDVPRYLFIYSDLLFTIDIRVQYTIVQ